MTEGITRVGVVLLNWNGYEFTSACIESLLASAFRPAQIMVFDNASTDDSPDRIMQSFPEVCVVRSDTNLGFTGGNNRGIQRLLATDTDLIWILNNDTVVDGRCLEILVAEMQRESDIAVATGKILFEAPPDMIWYAGANWRYWSLSAPHIGQLESDRGQYDRAADVGFVSGCCMLVRRSAFETVGLFDERFFAYSEDADWCLRARQAGLRLRYVPQAVLWHKVSASLRKNTLGTSAGKTSPYSYYLTTRNRLFIIRQYADRPWEWLTALVCLLGNCFYLSAGFIALRRWRKLSSLWRGVYDGFTQNLAL
jgi:GT2 family glycosyltransferase